MKHKDLRPCANCGKGVMHAGNPIFYRVKVETFGVDCNAVQRQAGLEMMLGGHAGLANVMGPDDDMASLVCENIRIFCSSCMLDVNVGHFLEGD